MYRDLGEPRSPVTPKFSYEDDEVERSPVEDGEIFESLWEDGEIFDSDAEAEYTDLLEASIAVHQKYCDLREAGDFKEKSIADLAVHQKYWDAKEAKEASIAEH
jgi:hypothetical protein